MAPSLSDTSTPEQQGASTPNSPALDIAPSSSSNPTREQPATLRTSSTSPRTRKLYAVITISFAFFIAEIIVGFRTGSLALVADAFHYFNDVIGLVVALVAQKLSERTNAPRRLTFGWTRATILGSFFNGTFLLALGVSIFLSAIERFINVHRIDHPLQVVILGAVGLTLNILSVLIVHEHHHHHHHHPGSHPVSNSRDLDAELESALPPDSAISSHSRADIGMQAVLLHVLSDALNNLAVIAAGLIIMFVKSPGKYYADPAISVAIALMIFCSTLPLTWKAGRLLLGSIPDGLNVAEVMAVLEAIPGVQSVHELQIWCLSQEKVRANVHVVVSEDMPYTKNEWLRSVAKCLNHFGIVDMTVQVEDGAGVSDRADNGSEGTGMSRDLGHWTKHARNVRMTEILDGHAALA